MQSKKDMFVPFLQPSRYNGWLSSLCTTELYCYPVIVSKEKNEKKKRIVVATISKLPPIDEEM